MEVPHVASWADAVEDCIICRKKDYGTSFGPRTLILCSCCQSRGIHVECLEATEGKVFFPEEIARREWICSEICKKVDDQIRGLYGVKVPKANNYSFQILQFHANDKASSSAADSAFKLLKAAFDVAELEGGECLLHRVCHAARSDDRKDSYDYSAFHLALLRKGPTLISVATVRIWGDRFAEMPFVVTREGHRHSGNFRMLIEILESMLKAMHVRYMLVPCVTSLLGMWAHKFNYEPITSAERAALEDQIILLDPETVHLVKKQIYRNPEEAQKAESSRPLASQGQEQILLSETQTLGGAGVASRGRPAAEGIERFPRRAGKRAAAKKACMSLKENSGSSSEDADKENIDPGNRGREKGPSLILRKPKRTGKLKHAKLCSIPEEKDYQPSGTAAAKKAESLDGEASQSGAVSQHSRNAKAEQSNCRQKRKQASKPPGKAKAHAPQRASSPKDVQGRQQAVGYARMYSIWAKKLHGKKRAKFHHAKMDIKARADHTMAALVEDAVAKQAQATLQKSQTTIALLKLQLAVSQQEREPVAS